MSSKPPLTDQPPVCEFINPVGGTELPRSLRPHHCLTLLIVARPILRFSHHIPAAKLTLSSIYFAASPVPLPSDEKSSLGAAQQKDRTISIEDHPRVDEGVEGEDPAAPTTINSLRRGTSARRRTNVPAPLQHSSSTRSRRSARETPHTPRALSLQSMGIIKNKNMNPDGTPRWVEPTLKQSIRSIVFASCKPPHLLNFPFCSFIDCSGVPM